MSKGGECTNLKITYKKAFVVACVVLAVLVTLTMYNTFAVPGPFTVPKPYSADLVPEIVFTVDTIDFTYSSGTQQYTSCDVVVRNTHASDSFSGSVSVILKDTVPATIASGSNTFSSLAAGSTATVTVTLVWTAGKTVADLGTSTLLVMPT